MQIGGNQAENGPQNATNIACFKVMESEEALKYYLDEVKDSQNDINNIEEEIHLPNGESILMVMHNFMM